MQWWWKGLQCLFVVFLQHIADLSSDLSFTRLVYPGYVLIPGEAGRTSSLFMLDLEQENLRLTDWKTNSSCMDGCCWFHLTFFSLLPNVFAFFFFNFFIFSILIPFSEHECQTWNWKILLDSPPRFILCYGFWCFTGSWSLGEFLVHSFTANHRVWLLCSCEAFLWLKHSTAAIFMLGKLALELPVKQPWFHNVFCENCNHIIHSLYPIQEAPPAGGIK